MAVSAVTGVVVGGVIALWSKIKDFAWRLTSIIIHRVNITTSEAHESIIAYLLSNYETMRSNDSSVGAMHETLRNGRYGLVPYEQYGNNSVMFWGSKKYLRFFRPFFIFSITKDETQSPERSYGETEQNKVYSSIVYLRRTLNVNQIVEEACNKTNSINWDDKKSQRFDIFYLPDRDSEHHHYLRKSRSILPWYNQQHYRLLGIQSEEIGKPYTKSGKALDNLIFPEQIKNLIKSIDLWHKSREWYQERNIPWKSGWLLHGPPGTGKTALARAFAEDLNMPIYVFNLSQMNNTDLINAWKKMQSNVPCIALIEDIDNVFDGRKNIVPRASLMAAPSEEGNISHENAERYMPLTFDCLLNCLDGVDKSQGIFTIITTNDLSKVDEAIGVPKEHGDQFSSTRPGRIDKVIHLTYMTREDKIKMANRILSETPEVLKNFLEELKEEDETPAQFQSRCAQIAVNEYWKSKANS